MLDRYEGIAPVSNGPAIDAFDIVPSDTSELSEVTRAIFVGQGGTITAVTKSGTTVTFENVTNGAILPLRVSKVLASGTTALALVGLV
jgi:hypothetical protein